MCNEIMMERISEVWRKRKGSFCYSAGLLIMDFVKSHLVESVKAAANKMSASLAIILGELIKCLQLLDLSVNKSFKVKCTSSGRHGCLKDFTRILCRDE